MQRLTVDSILDQLNNVISNTITKYIPHVEINPDYQIVWIKLDNNVFKNIKKITGYKARGKFPEIIESDGHNIVQYSETSDKANALGTFTNNNQDLSNFHPYPHWHTETPSQTTSTLNIPGKITITKNNKEHIDFVDARKLTTLIKSLNKKKSSGFDSLPNYALKKLSCNFYTFLAIFFNQIFNLGYYPKKMEARYNNPNTQARQGREISIEL